jgi:hypothetical protein
MGFVPPAFLEGHLVGAEGLIHRQAVRLVSTFEQDRRLRIDQSRLVAGSGERKIKLGKNQVVEFDGSGV